jgi:hypothetical protein
MSASSEKELLLEAPGGAIARSRPQAAAQSHATERLLVELVAGTPRFSAF